MTNKTITLDHAVAERMSKAIEQDKLFKYNDLQALREALADPVPPTGGEPGSITLSPEHAERLLDRLSKAQMFKDTTELRAAMAQSKLPIDGLPERHDLPHRSEFETANQYTSALDTAKTWNAACDEWAPHVTRLQAEVERLKLDQKTLTDANHRQAMCIHHTAQSMGPEIAATVDALPKAAKHLQSELTKARELLTDACGALEKARDVLRSILRDKVGGVHYASAQTACHMINAALSNQSAPADKTTKPGRWEIGDQVQSPAQLRCWECIEAGTPGKWEEKQWSYPGAKPAGNDRVSMVGVRIYGDGTGMPVKHTMNGLIVNLDGYTMYAPGVKPAPVAVVLTDEQVFEAIRPALDKSDGGYICDTDRESAIKAGRAVLAAFDEVTRLNSEPQP